MELFRIFSCGTSLMVMRSAFFIPLWFWRPSTVNYEAMKFRQSCGLFPSTTLSCYGISNAENLFMERVVELSGKSMNE